MQAVPEPESGVFSELQLARCLDTVRARMATGRVRVTQGGVERSLWLEEGNVRGIASSLEDEKLGSWLVSRGLTARSVVDLLRSRMAAGERLGSVLVREAVLDESGLHEALDALTTTLCERMLLQEGSYRTEPGARLATDACTVNSLPAPLFVAAVRRTENLEAFVRLLGGGLLWEAAGSDARSDLELSSVEKYVLSHLRPPRTLHELRSLLPRGFDEVARALSCLAAAGLASPLRGRSASVTTPPWRPPTADEGAEEEATEEGTEDDSPFPPASPRLHALFTRLEPDVEDGPRRLPTGVRVPTATEQRKALAFQKTALRLLAGGEDSAQARRLLAQAARLFPDPDILVPLAKLEMEQQRWWQRALRHLKQALAAAPAHTEGWLTLAAYWRMREQPDKERYCLQKILAYDPTNGEARRRLKETTTTT